MLARIAMDAADGPDSAKRNHRLLFELGRGGMGTVFLAVTEGPSGFRKLKVVKRLRADLAADPDFLKMFLDEARLCARLAHANVVQTNEVGFDGTHYYLEMEYLEGQTLEALLRVAASRPDSLPLPVSLWIVAQTLAGLHYAHELTNLSGAPLHVVHRDVSPHNVFVTYDGSVKVLDFGIAKAIDSTVDTRTGGVRGKVSYMSPEQAGRRPIDRRTDVFSAGVILWRVLTGRRLWSGLSDGEIFERLSREAIPSPRTTSPEIPEELESICMRALAGDPANRFASAEEMQRALEDRLDKEGARTSARQVATTIRTLFGARREEERRRIEASLQVAPTSDEHDVPSLLAPWIDVETKRGDARITASGLAGPSTAHMQLGPEPTPSLAPRGWTLPRAALGVLGAAGLVASIFALLREPSTVTPPLVVAPSTAPPRCVLDVDCANAPVAAVCRANRCVPLASPDCVVLSDPSKEHDSTTIWLGAMLPLSGDDGRMFGQANANAVDLARRDFVTMHGGLPSVTIGAPVRPLGVVMCDDSVDAARAAAHLVDDLEVPAIIGFHSSRELTDLASSLFIPKGVLSIAALNTSPLVTRLPHPDGSPRLVWRTTFNSADCAIPLARVVEEVFEPELRAIRVISKSVHTRVAVVRSGNSASLSAVDALSTALRFNGLAAMENGDDFRQFDTESATTVSDLIAYHPHVIVYLDAKAFTERIVPALEAGWPADVRYRPRYASFGTAGFEALYDFIGTDAERRHRFFAVELEASTAPNLDFTNRYNLAFKPSVTPATAPGVAYDAFYLLAFAAYATGDAKITGANLARAIARLVPTGVAVDLRPTRIDAGLDALRAGGNIDLVGAATSLDFDLATGDVHSDFAIYCVSSDAHGKAVGTIESGLIYRAASQQLEGTMRCP